MRPLKYIPRYSVKDYNLWEGDWELIDGLPYAMSPSPVKRHQHLASVLLTKMSLALEKLKDSCKDCIVVSELDWIIDDSNVVHPDVAIICDKTGDFITSPPALIIEILSPSSAFKDRQVKFDIYQEQGVKNYIIADPDTKTYQIFKLVNDNYQEQKSTSEFSINNQCVIELDVQAALSVLE